MVSALGPLQRLERGCVVGLPLEPAPQALLRLGLGRAAPFVPERVAIVLALGVREPLATPFDAHQAIVHVADRDPLHEIVPLFFPARLKAGYDPLVLLTGRIAPGSPPTAADR